MPISRVIASSSVVIDPSHEVQETKMITAFAIATLMAIEVPAAHSRPSLAHTRPLSDIAQRLLADARRLSPTIETMLAEIERTDVIVYIDLVMSGGTMGEGGATQLAGANGVARFVRVTIDRQIDPGLRTEILGHELQHVLEIARAPEVRDDAGMKNLFRRIGWVSKPSQYETEAAIETQRLVHRDLWTSAPTHGASRL